MVRDGVMAEADALARRFASAAPFRHLQIEDFLEASLADRLLAEFPTFAPGRALNENGVVGNKAVHESIRDLGPAYLALDELVRSDAFLALVSRITGIPDLLYDPLYIGGGTHENRDGQVLDAHVDFNRHPVTHAHRRLNLIVYLNHGWRDAWGGVLELHRDPRAADDEIVRVSPQFNRAVLFETTESSWHGFSRIQLPPDRSGLTRRSVALYFYSAERPEVEFAGTHSTVYVDPPLPARFAAGHTLTDDDIAELRGLVARRDQHLQRLYRDLQQGQVRLEQALRLAGMARGSWPYRALQALRRGLGALRRGR